MVVSELIAELQRCDPNSEVFVNSSDGECMPIGAVSKRWENDTFTDTIIIAKKGV